MPALNKTEVIPAAEFRARTTRKATAAGLAPVVHKVTYYLQDGKFGMCSSNLDLNPKMEGLYAEVANELGIEQKLRDQAADLPDDEWIAIQGEIIGEGINGNHYGIAGRQFHVSNVFIRGVGCFSRDAAEHIVLDMGLQFDLL